MEQRIHQPKPDWLKIKLRTGKNQQKVEELLRRLSLNTVCTEANCPNLMECFGKGSAAFMILGKHCTRNCTFCCVEKGNPQPVNADEPCHVAKAVQELGLKHVVVTSVTRDDLPDGGAGHFAMTVKEVRNQNTAVIIEVLIPDFNGDLKALSSVVKAEPDIINHNIETVPRLYPEVRPMAVYERSLHLLAAVRDINPRIYTKSGIMVGLGETEAEVIKSLEDLRKVNCDILTIGQYLAPSKEHHPVVEYIHPDVFKRYKEAAEAMGFLYVASAPLVRSSYQAEKAADIFGKQG